MLTPRFGQVGALISIVPPGRKARPGSAFRPGEVT